MYFVEIRSTISQAASPSIHSTTLPRTMTGWNGLSGGVRERATRGSRRRLRAFWEPGPVMMATWSPYVPIQTGTEWGAPSGRTLARWASEVPSSTRRTSGLSTVIISWWRSLGSLKRLHDRNTRSSLREPQLLDCLHATHELQGDGLLHRADPRRDRRAVVAADPA